MVNYYQILNIDKHASESEIKKAYRRLALLYHPDRNDDNDSNAKFILINKAYSTLIDPQKRKQYDLSLEFGITLEILLKKLEREQRERDKKYGTSYKFKDEYHTYKKQNTFSHEDEKQFVQLEKFMFFILIIIACYGAYFGIKRFFFEEWDHFELPVAGVIFAILFPTLLIYGYRVIYKRKY